MAQVLINLGFYVLVLGGISSLLCAAFGRRR